MSFCTISVYYTINQYIKSVSLIQKPSKIPVFRAFSSVFCPFLHDFRSIFTHFCSIFAQNSLDFVHFHSKITHSLHDFHAFRSFSCKFYSGQNRYSVYALSGHLTQLHLEARRILASETQDRLLLVRGQHLAIRGSGYFPRSFQGDGDRDFPALAIFPRAGIDAALDALAVLVESLLTSSPLYVSFSLLSDYQHWSTFLCSN